MRHSFHCPFGCCSGGTPRLLGCGVWHLPPCTLPIIVQMLFHLKWWASWLFILMPNLLIWSQGRIRKKKKRKRKLSLSLCRGTKFTKGKHVSLLCGEVSKSWEGCYLHKEAGRGDTWSRWLLRRQCCCRHVAVNTCTWHSWAPAPVARSKPNPVGLVYINQRWVEFFSMNS